MSDFLHGGEAELRMNCDTNETLHQKNLNIEKKEVFLKN